MIFGKRYRLLASLSTPSKRKASKKRYVPPKHIPLWSAALVWRLTYGFALENRFALGFPMGLSLLCLLGTHSPEDQPDDQSQNGGSHPAETDGCKGQNIAHRGDQSVRVEQRPDALRQCPQEIV